MEELDLKYLQYALAVVRYGSVTQAARALYLARALGLEAWGVAADGQNYPGQTMRDVREILARDKDFLWAILQPEAAILGGPEPLK